MNRISQALFDTLFETGEDSVLGDLGMRIKRRRARKKGINPYKFKVGDVQVREITRRQPVRLILPSPIARKYMGEIPYLNGEGAVEGVVQVDSPLLETEAVSFAYVMKKDRYSAISGRDTHYSLVCLDLSSADVDGNGKGLGVREEERDKILREMEKAIRERIESAMPRERYQRLVRTGDESKFRIKTDSTQPSDEQLHEALRNRAIPSRFWYDRKGAELYLSAERNGERTLLTEHVDEIMRKIDEKEYNIHLLGPGSGQKERILVDAFSKGNRIEDVCAVDISLDMLYETFEELSNERTYIGLQTTFEELDVVEGNKIIVMLGNTWGNFEPQEFLDSLAQNFDQGDYFLVGVELESNPMLDKYRTPEAREFMFHPLERAGFEPDDVEYMVVYNDSEARVEVQFELKKPKTISYDSRAIDFQPGERIIAGYSYRFNKDYIGELFDRVGLVMVEYFEDETNALVLGRYTGK